VVTKTGVDGRLLSLFLPVAGVSDPSLTPMRLAGNGRGSDLLEREQMFMLGGGTVASVAEQGDW
jgi:hypothetical protein